MKVFLATIALIASLTYRMMPKVYLPKRRKKVVSKKQNKFIYNSLQARIYTLQVLGSNSNFSDSQDN